MKNVELEQISTGIEAFEQRKTILKEQVAKSLSLFIISAEDKAGYELVKRHRIDLRKFEIDIENEAKSMRGLVKPITDLISSSEKDLLKISNPEFERLKGLEIVFEKENERIKFEKEEAERLIIESRILAFSKYGETLDEIDAATLNDTDFGVKLEAVKLAYEIEQSRIEKEKNEAESLRLAEIELQNKIAADNKIESERLAKIAEEMADKEAELNRFQKAIEDKQSRLNKSPQDAIDAELNAKKDIEDAQIRVDELKAVEATAAFKAVSAMVALQLKEKIAAEKKAARQPDRTKLIDYANFFKSVSCLPITSEEAKSIVAKAEEMKAAIINYITTQTETL